MKQFFLKLKLFPSLYKSGPGYVGLLKVKLFPKLTESSFFSYLSDYHKQMQFCNSCVVLAVLQ